MSHLSSHTSSGLAAPNSLTQVLPPQLPPHIEVWSTRALTAWLHVSTSTVKYHARQAFRGHSGRWELSRDQAQRVVNRIFQFGQVHTLSKPAESETTKDKIADVVGLNSCSEPAPNPEPEKIERLLNVY